MKLKVCLNNAEHSGVTGCGTVFYQITYFPLVNSSYTMFTWCHAGNWPASYRTGALPISDASGGRWAATACRKPQPRCCSLILVNSSQQSTVSRAAASLVRLAAKSGFCHHESKQVNEPTFLNRREKRRLSGRCVVVFQSCPQSRQRQEVPQPTSANVV